MNSFSKSFSKADFLLARIPSKVVLRTILVLVVLDLWVIVALMAPPPVQPNGNLTAADRKAFQEAISYQTLSFAIQAFARRHVDRAGEAMGWRKTMVCDRFVQMPDGSCWVRTTVDPSAPIAWHTWNFFVRTNGTWKLAIWGADMETVPKQILDAN